MTDSALNNAEVLKKQYLDRRLALHSEIADLDAKIGKIDTFIRDWHLFASNSSELPVDKSVNIENKSEPSPNRAKRTRSNSKKEDIAKAAREIILERGDPVMRDELYEALTARGLKIEGHDPQMVLSTMLWRMRHEITRLGRGGYWVAEMPSPDGSYVPNAIALKQATNYEEML